MNFNTAFDLLMQRLGNRTETDLRASMVVEALHVQQNILEANQFTPWFLETEGALATVADTANVALPTDFITMGDEQHLYVDSEGSEAYPWTKLGRKPKAVLIEKYKDYSKAKPLAYALDTELVFRPIPDAIYALKLQYMRQDPVLPSDTAVTNLWLTHAAEWFIGELGVIMAGQYIQDTDLVAIFTAQAMRGKATLQYADTARGEAAMLRSMGDD